MRRFLRTGNTMPRIDPLPLIAGAAGGVLFARERQSKLAMERFAAATLETLLNAIDANDAETGQHVRRVAAYSIVLAEEAMLDEPMVRSIERVALFHDIGKIHAALYDIVHDDTGLTPAERRALATHPARGAMVLAPVARFYPDLAQGVLAHHERWDGRGYPRGIHGPRIPLAARVVAIADTFDVVSHGRLYRAGKSLQSAANVIANGRATQFDPNLVDLFLFPPVFDRIVRARDALKRPRGHRASGERRVKRDEPPAPDVQFRWRRPVARGAGGGVALRDIRDVARSEQQTS
jgi:HD-GYP domain-containing protein (c-di-GMP phosphodiesterase class II)